MSAKDKVLIFLLLLLSILIMGIQPYFEMLDFNRHTKGVKATYWEAIFSDLRIIPEQESK